MFSYHESYEVRTTTEQGKSTMHEGDQGDKVSFDLTRELTKKEEITDLILITLSTDKGHQNVD